MERLCYIGARGMGALEFRPVLGPRARKSTIDVDALVTLASDILTERDRFKTNVSSASRRKALADTHHDRYLWALDRHANVAEIIDLKSGKWVNTVHLTGTISDDPAPDLVDASPDRNRLFVALRGSVPLSGDPHNAQGTTPGLGIIQVTQGGRSGRLVARVPMTNANQQAGQAPDAHGLRVRLRGLKK